MRYANYDVKLLQMCILTSIFSQIESISSLMRPIMYIAWIVTAVFFIARNRGRIVIHTKGLLWTKQMILLLTL